MTGTLHRTRAKLRVLLGGVLRPLGWKAAGRGQWLRNHGEFEQRFWLQPSTWTRSDNYLNCMLWHRKLGGTRPKRRPRCHVELRTGHIDKRRAVHFDKALETSGKQVARGAWQEQVEKLLHRICLPWFDRIDSIDALVTDLRRYPYMGVSPPLYEAVQRRRARKRRKRS